jgi:WD40 repeat protein
MTIQRTTFLVFLCNFMLTNLWGQDSVLQQVQLVVQTKLKGNVSGVEFSRDGRFLAACGSDNTIVIWDISTGLQAYVLDGHKSRVTDMSFSGDSRYLASGGDDNLVKVWDLASGKLKTALKMHGPSVNNGSERITQVRFHPSRPIVASAGMDGRLIFSAMDGSILASKQFGKGDITTLKFNPPGDILAVAGVNIHYLYLLHVKPTADQAIEIIGIDSIPTPENKAIWSLDFYDKDNIVFSTTGSLRFLNICTGEAKTLLLGKRQTPYRLHISSKYNLMAANIDGDSVFVWEYPGGKKIAGIPFAQPITGLSAPLDSSLLHIDTTDPYGIKPVDIAMVKLAKADGIDLFDVTRYSLLMGQYGESPQGFAFSPDGPNLVLQEKESIDFIDVHRTKTVQKITTTSLSAVRSVTFNSSGNALFFIHGRNTIKQFDLSKLEITRSFDIESINPLVLIRYLNDSVLACMDETGNFIYYNMKNGTQKSDLFVNDFDVQQGRPYLLSKNNRLITEDENGENPSAALSFSGERKIFAINALKQIVAVYNDQRYPGTIEIWNYATNTLVDTLNCAQRANNIAISADGKYIAYNEEFEGSTRSPLSIIKDKRSPDEMANDYWKELKQNKINVVDIPAHQKIASFDEIESGLTNLKFTPSNELLATGKNRTLMVWDYLNKRLKDEFTGHSIAITDIAENQYHIIASCDGDGGDIRLWDTEADKNILTLIPFDGYDFLIVNDQNYYCSTKNSVRNVAFRYRNGTYTFDQFDPVLNRPDLVARSYINYDTSNAALFKEFYDKRIKQPARSGDLRANKSPVLEIDMKENVSRDTIHVLLHATDPFDSLAFYNCWVNDVPLFGLRGVPIPKDSAKVFNTSFPVPLSYGKNVIQASVTSRSGWESLRKDLIVDNVNRAKKPSLYLVAVGVSDYKNMDSLYYPGKDAGDLIEMFKSYNQKYAGFNAVYCKKWINQQALSDSILSLSTFINTAGVNDIVLIYLSGHAIKNTTGYYFLPYDYGKKLISYLEIDSILTRTKSRKKILILNTCYSGEIDPDFDKYTRMQMYFSDLRKSGGTCVLSSSEGQNSATAAINAFEDVKNGLIVNSIKGILERGEPLQVTSFFQKIILDNSHYQLVKKTDLTIRYQSINNDFDLLP